MKNRINGSGSKQCLRKNLPVKRSVTIFVFFLCSYYYAQSGSVDSLLHRLTDAKGTEKVKILSDLCWEYRYSSVDSSLLFGHKALKLAETLNYPAGIAQTCNDLGVVYMMKGDYDLAVKLFYRALMWRKELNDSTGIAAVLNKIGMIHKERGRLDSALACFISALDIYEKIRHTQGIAHMLNNVAVVYMLQQNYDSALEYFFKSLKIKEKQKDDYGISGTLLNIGNIFYYKRSYRNAIPYLLSGIEYAKKVNELLYIGQGLNNIGSCYLELQVYDTALQYLTEALPIRLQLQDKKGEASTLINLANCYLHLKHFLKAEQYMSDALKMAQEIGAKQEIMNAHLNLSLLYNTTGEQEKAYEEHIEYSAMRDSILNEERNNQIASMQVRYETEKKEKEIAVQKLQISHQQLALNRRKVEVIFLSGIILLLFFSGFLFYRQQRLKRRHLREVALMEQKDIHMRAMVEGEEHERRRLAGDLHDGLGQMLSTLKMNVSSVLPDNGAVPPEEKEKTLNLIDEACNELRSVSHNLMPATLIKAGLIPALHEIIEKINHTGNLQVILITHGLEKRMDNSKEINIYRIIQELLNNGLKHSGATEIIVQLTRDERELTVTVEDNGKGFDVPAAGEASGIGWKNILSRIAFLKGAVNVDSQPGKGTTVAMDVPL
ncbi:MAG: DUF5112 domain-containing protein [Bacteroidetes bacterium]|nr:DUF5112 domain-containing protein [Bacteroidota bacterium]